jgi:hypothetical protein
MPVLDSATKESAATDSADPTIKPAKAAGNWDSLRGLATGVQKKHRAASFRTALLALLLILTCAFLGWILHDHLPSLVNFGKEVGDTVAKFASDPSKPSKAARSTAARDQRSAHMKPRSNRANVRHAESRPDATYDPLLRPFYATALIGGRRVFLTSNDTVIVLDIASGQWSIESESP